jgi:C4-dicarboxylate-specific signal transduction histidine kinase
VISILGQLFIHVSPRQLYYRNSIFISGLCQGVLVYQMWLSWTCFRAVINACETVWTYYEVKTGDRKTALANQRCTDAHLYHGSWLVFNAVLLLLRFVSLLYLIKGLLYLLKREKERERRLARQLLKAKRFRERRRVELERKIERKRRELRKAQLQERLEMDELEVAEEERRIAQRELDR